MVGAACFRIHPWFRRSYRFVVAFFRHQALLLKIVTAGHYVKTRGEFSQLACGYLVKLAAEA